MNRLTRVVHIHTFPHCDVLSVADPTEILPPGRSPKQHLTPGHFSLGTPAHTTQYLRDAARAGGRGWKGEGPTRPRTTRSGPGPGPGPGSAAVRAGGPAPQGRQRGLGGGPWALRGAGGLCPSGRGVGAAIWSPGAQTPRLGSRRALLTSILGAALLRRNLHAAKFSHASR